MMLIIQGPSSGAEPNFHLWIHPCNSVCPIWFGDHPVEVENAGCLALIIYCLCVPFVGCVLVYFLLGPWVYL